MIELLTGEVMMGALADILIWCLVFVGIYILCRIQRIKKDIIGNALEDAGKMKKYNKILVNLINKDVYDKKSIRKALSKIKYIAKNTRSMSISLKRAKTKILALLHLFYHQSSMKLLNLQWLSIRSQRKMPFPHLTRRKEI